MGHVHAISDLKIWERNWKKKDKRTKWQTADLSSANSPKRNLHVQKCWCSLNKLCLKSSNETNQKSQVVFSRFISNIFLSIYIPVTFKKRNPLTAPSSFLSHFGKCLRFFPPYFKQSRAPSRVNCVWERARRPFAWVLALALAGENWPLTFSRRDPWANLSPSPFVNLVDTRSTRERDQHERDFAERMKLKEMERDFPRQSK